MPTTKKTTTTRRAKPAAAKVSKPIEEDPVEAVQQKHKPDDLITCKSITAGKLIYVGPRTQIQYVWEDAGAEQQMEYQDLMSAILSRSNYVFLPRFIIEDDSIINDPRWSELQDVYNNLYDAGDIRELLSGKTSISAFKTAIRVAPEGLVKALQSEMAQGIQSGTFDSLGKLKAMDELLGTKMVELLG